MTGHRSSGTGHRSPGISPGCVGVTMVTRDSGLYLRGSSLGKYWQVNWLGLTYSLTLHNKSWMIMIIHVLNIDIRSDESKIKYIFNKFFQLSM